MQKVILSFILLFSISFTAPTEEPNENNDFMEKVASVDEARLQYDRMSLEGLIRFEAFDAAYTGYKKLNSNNNPLLTVIDFSLPSTEKRMYVLDLAANEVLFVTHVAHGRNSGGNYATSFSNRHGSYQSSLGFYRTANTYNGGNGHSRRGLLQRGVYQFGRPIGSQLRLPGPTPRVKPPHHRYH